MKNDNTGSSPSDPLTPPPHCDGCDRPDLCDIILPGTAPCGKNAGLRGPETPKPPEPMPCPWHRTTKGVVVRTAYYSDRIWEVVCEDTACRFEGFEARVIGQTREKALEAWNRRSVSVPPPNNAVPVMQDVSKIREVARAHRFRESLTMEGRFDLAKKLDAIADRMLQRVCPPPTPKDAIQGDIREMSARFAHVPPEGRFDAAVRALVRSENCIDVLLQQSEKSRSVPPTETPPAPLSNAVTDAGSEICPKCGELDWSEDGGLAGHSWVCDEETTPGRPSDDELQAWAGALRPETAAEKDAHRFATYLLRLRKLSRSGPPKEEGHAFPQQGALSDER